MIVYSRLFLTALLFLVSDQLTKEWIARILPPNSYFIESSNPPIPVVEGFFYIVHIYNPGAAWGIMEGMGTWLGLLGFVAIGAIYWFRESLGLKSHYLQYVFGMLVGGILGNMIDRFRFGHVVDFLDFHLPGYRYPAFNVADCGITVGVALYMLWSLRESILEHKKKPKT